MKRFYPLFLFFLLFVIGCSSMSSIMDSFGIGSIGTIVNTSDISDAVASSFFLSTPTEDGIVFIGVVGKRRDPKETLQLALEEAARRVAVFYKVQGEYLSEINIGSGAFDYTNNTQTMLRYDEEGSRQYVDALRHNPDTDAIEIDNTLIIRTTYPSSLPAPVSFRPTYARGNGKPDWVDNPPLQIEGYEVGIGYAGRHSTISAACTVSYNNAIFSIVRNVGTRSRSSDLLYQATDSLFAYKTLNENMIHAQASLENFYVLDMWIDPQTKVVWTLAIAKKGADIGGEVLPQDQGLQDQAIQAEEPQDQDRSTN